MYGTKVKKYFLRLSNLYHFSYFRIESTEEEIQHETASLTSNSNEGFIEPSLSNSQPDVLSGLENVTISEHLENTESNVNENGGDPDSPTMSKSSSSEFESIYDKYRDKSDDEQATAQDETHC